MKPTIISVVMNAYNKENYIGATIESILNQTFEDFEFIIVNDGSTDKTADVIALYKDPRIRVFHQKNSGVRATLNKGFSEAKGKYIAHIDADDLSTPDRLQIQLDFMEKHPECVLAGCWCKVIDENENLIETWCRSENDLGIRWEHLFDNVLGHSGYFIRNGVINTEDWYQLPYAEEYDLAVRLSKIGKLACIPEFLVIYRNFVQSGIMHSRWNEQKSYAEEISMRQLKELMGEDSITIQERRAAWKLINRPCQIQEPETDLAVQTLKRIAKEFKKCHNSPEADDVIKKMSALYAKKLLLPVEGGRISQLRHLRGALKLCPRITEVKNILAALIYSVIGPQNGYQLLKTLKKGFL